MGKDKGNTHIKRKKERKNYVRYPDISKHCLSQGVYYTSSLHYFRNPRFCQYLQWLLDCESGRGDGVAIAVGELTRGAGGVNEAVIQSSPSNDVVTGVALGVSDPKTKSISCTEIYWFIQINFTKIAKLK